MHLDVEVDELDAAVADAIALGASVAEYQPQENVRVLLDPAGHPFCLYLDALLIPGGRLAYALNTQATAGLDVADSRAGLAGCGHDR